MASSAIKEIEAKAMELSAADRANLVEAILKSLVPPEDEILNAWIHEARRRDLELGDRPEAGIPAAEAIQRARAAIS